jgi:hypothetical protein
MNPPAKLGAAFEPLIARLELAPENLHRVAGCTTAESAVSVLEGAGALTDAVRVAAHALPRREAVWWACMCARAVPSRPQRMEDMTALDAAEAWVRRPDEPCRRAAHAAAGRAGFSSAEAWAAMGAFWSGGSMAPEGQPVVAPAEDLTGKAVSGSILITAARREPERGEARLRRFLAAARDIAGGGAGRIPEEVAER